MKNIQTIAKNCAISTGIAISMILFLEASYKIARFTRARIRSPNINEIYRDKFIAFDKKVSLRDLKAMKSEVGDHLMYRPWIQIGNYDHEGKFSEVVNGSRVVKDSELLKDCVSKKQIWMFGGSTTYGIGVPYSENIPSYLQEILNKNNTCLKVVNYGVPFHYSKQETINFIINLLDNENPPLFAIFLDGLNDFLQPGSTLRGEPYFTPLLRNIVFKGQNRSGKRNSNFKKLIDLEVINFLQRKLFKYTISNLPQYNNYELPNNYNEENAVRKISESFIKNTISLGKICEAYSVKCFRFLQPVAAVEYTPPSNDALTQWVQDEKSTSRFKIGYSSIRNSTNERIRGISLIDISKLFKNYSGIPYIDFGHYAPRANKLIAESIYFNIAPVINHN